MLEKFSKRFGAKAADGAIEGAKESLNDRLDKYSDIIEIGLVILVIGLGGNKLIGHGKKSQQNGGGYLPGNGMGFGGETANGSPIVINNYYTGQPIEREIYGKRGARAQHGRQGKNYQKR